MKYNVKHGIVKTPTRSFRSGEMIEGQELTDAGIDIGRYVAMGAFEPVRGTEARGETVPEPLPEPAEITSIIPGVESLELPVAKK